MKKEQFFALEKAGQRGTGISGGLPEKRIRESSDFTAS